MRPTNPCKRDLLIRRDNAGGLHASLAEFLGRSCNRELARILSSKLTTVAQICCLVPCTTEGAGAQKGLVVVNTHLFFHPGAAHIRMLLVSAILREVQAARQKWEGETGLPLAVILAGDLNSEPDTGAIELLGSGQVSAQHQEWVAAASFAWGDTDADAEGLEVLYHLLSLLDLRCLRQGPCLPQVRC
jgi:2',5'-phosphodiesterase